MVIKVIDWIKWLFTPDYGAPDYRPDNPPSAETPMRRGGGQPRPKTPSGVRQQYQVPKGAQERVVPPPMAQDGRRPPRINPSRKFLPAGGSYDPATDTLTPPEGWVTWEQLQEQNRQREPVATGQAMTIPCSGCHKALWVSLKESWGEVYCWDCACKGEVECLGCHRLLSANVFAQASPVYCYDCRQEG